MTVSICAQDLYDMYISMQDFTHKQALLEIFSNELQKMFIFQKGAYLHLFHKTRPIKKHSLRQKTVLSCWYTDTLPRLIGNDFLNFLLKDQVFVNR